MLDRQTIDSIKNNLRLIVYGRTSSATATSHFLLLANIFIILASLLGFLIDLGANFVYVEFGFGVLFLAEYLIRF